VDDYKPPDTLKEDDARKDGNLNMRLKMVHIENIKSRLKPEKNMNAAEPIHLFYLNPTSRFGFKEVVQDIIADKIYYRLTTTLLKKASGTGKSKADEYIFDDEVLVESLQFARQGANVQEKNKQ
jgi:hypothetical protein